MNLKEQPDEEFNSVAAKLKRAQDHIAKLQQENAYLKNELRKLDKKYCDALRKAGIYRRLMAQMGGLEMTKDETLPVEMSTDETIPPSAEGCRKA